MFKNYLVTSLRNLWKRKGYLIINVLGLAIGIASFTFISLYVLHELSYDRFHKKIDNIYRAGVEGQMSGQLWDAAITAPPMAAALLADYPEVENVVRIRRAGAWLIKYKDKTFNEDGMLFADSTFFEIFDFKVLEGDPKQVLRNPRSVVLTEEYAVKYFGDEDPIGKQLMVEEDTIHYMVTGIVENIPDNSHFHFDMLASLNTLGSSRRNNWVSHNYYTYVLLADGTDPQNFQTKMQEMIAKYVGPQIEEILGFTMDDFTNQGNYLKYKLFPLKDIHLRSTVEDELEPNGNIQYVHIFSIIAILILIIAVINYVNLATAKSATRAKEVGIRKVSGGTRKGLIYQFISESIILTITSGIVAVVLVGIFTPDFEKLIGKSLAVNLFDNPNGILLLFGLFIIVGILAGIYPAFVLANYRPTAVLKGSISKGVKSPWLRNSLVVFQFAVSIAIIIGTIVVFNQLQYLQNKNLGFDKEQLLVVRRPDALGNHLESLKSELVTNPNIKGVANANAIPGKDNYSSNAMYKEDDPDKNTYLIWQNRVSFEYPELMGFELINGRFFSKEYGTDSTAMIINEAAAEVLGWDNPIGKNILRPTGDGFQKYPVVGLVKNYHIQSLHKEIVPACMTIMPGNWEGYLCIRLSTENIKNTIEFAEDIWYSYTQKQPFQYFFFDEDYNKLYYSEMKTGSIFLVFAILAIFIACIGLLGLIAYTATARTKEIGIRKVHGASIASLIRMLSFEVLKLIFIATIIAWPLAYLWSERWLQGFANHIDTNIIIYLLASLAALLIGWLSISYQAIIAANRNPIDTLRYE